MYTPPILATERSIVSTVTSLAAELGSLGAGAPASAVWPTALLAIFVPLYVQAPITAQQIWWDNGATITGSTSIECAVYNEAGTTKLITSGVVTHAGVSIPQAVTITGGYYLPRGRYWIGLVCANGTSTFLRFTNAAAVTNLQKLVGTSEQAMGAAALPATITFGTAAQAYIPVMGLTQSTLAI